MCPQLVTPPPQAHYCMVLAIKDDNQDGGEDKAHEGADHGQGTTRTLSDDLRFLGRRRPAVEQPSPSPQMRTHTRQAAVTLATELAQVPAATAAMAAPARSAVAAPQ